MSLLSLVPLKYRYAALISLCIAVYGFGYVDGLKKAQTAQGTIDANNKILALVSKVKQGEISIQEVTRYVDRIKIIKEQGATITKEVPIYITKDVDDKCAIPDEFRVWWNATNDTNNIP